MPIKTFARAATLALVFGGCATVPPAREDVALDSLVAAERAFARYALEQGVRAAFLHHFAPGGIVFVPQPASVDDVFAQPRGDPLATLLEWEPVASGVAASGDFGFTTGPARISRRDGSAPVRHSTFFSVWRRDAGRPWRVVIDAGAGSPQPVAHERLVPAPRVHPAAPGERGAMARSFDLAYTYGAVDGGKGGGHYLHLWTRAADGRAWRIAAALRLP